MFLELYFILVLVLALINFTYNIGIYATFSYCADSCELLTAVRLTFCLRLFSLPLFFPHVGVRFRKPELKAEVVGPLPTNCCCGDRLADLSPIFFSVSLLSCSMPKNSGECENSKPGSRPKMAPGRAH